ncbi:aminopeptidase P family protein [Pollutibacter soli]|uniref:aminopeptidase P family protein n=1 Tax=Pollutibacter soli TaxID=3034157 RepID=UPI0030140DEF
MFELNTYVERRRMLAEQVGEGILFFPGNIQSSMSYKDNHYPFRQDSSFLYFFGIDLPGLDATIDAATGETILYGEEPTEDDLVWTGPVTPLTEMAERVGIKKVRPCVQLHRDLAGLKQKHNRIHWLPPYRPETFLKIQELLQVEANVVTLLSSEAFIKAVVRLRSTKSEEEVREIESGVDFTVDMLLLAMKNGAAGIRECELASAMHSSVIAKNSQLAFPTILTVHGEILHNHYSNATVKPGQLILSDCGAESLMHYAGDMTRTFPADKTFNNQQKEIYQIVLNSFRHASGLLSPGILFRDVHLAACEQLVTGLKELGIFKGDTKDAVAAGAHTLLFPCGLGHMLGLDTHDMENLGEKYVGYTEELVQSKEFGLKSLRLGRALEEGFVLTVEPGLYFNPFLMDLWESQKKHVDFINYGALKKYRDFGGVRVEEDFYITAQGARKLGKHLPMEISEIEEYRR